MYIYFGENIMLNKKLLIAAAIVGTVSLATTASAFWGNNGNNSNGNDRARLSGVKSMALHRVNKD